VRPAPRAVALVVAFAALLWPSPSAQATTAGTVQIEIDPMAVTTHVSDRFSFHSTMRNNSNRPLPNLVAHLNVLSLDPDVYLDPEDWSSTRTQYLAGIAAGASTTLTWTVRAVTAGRVILYVTLVSQRDSDVINTSPALRATVIPQQELSATGVVPIAVATPLITLFLLAATIRRRRKLA